MSLDAIMTSMAVEKIHRKPLGDLNCTLEIKTGLQPSSISLSPGSSTALITALNEKSGCVYLVGIHNKKNLFVSQPISRIAAAMFSPDGDCILASGPRGGV
ncbi:MAG TPA: hypothetical protein PLM53_10985 [Spirochaetota bacterium]|nr:hypothetical protein [Spirochaetota bacterium]HPC41472.1 hypothetical protein [Spirochaetota bacterium]HPL18990.1 hypothetical protein [Spirochaetota bacterium]HQF09160.1 hypothetical protein [Spirochaetota bacterium]HQH97615.1 hypothetical protein [Spirochaetota bacterium]